eukprot:gene3246-4420_t
MRVLVLGCGYVGTAFAQTMAEQGALVQGTCRSADSAEGLRQAGITPILFNASLHIGYCNSRALEIAGVTAETPDPPGAAYGRDLDGRPNGVLQGQTPIFAVLGHNLTAMALDDVPEASRRVCEKANRVGVTTFCDQASGGFQGRRETILTFASAFIGYPDDGEREELRAALRKRPENFTAYDLTLRALAALNSHERASFSEARDFLAHAIAEAPDFAMPVALLAR